MRNFLFILFLLPTVLWAQQRSVTGVLNSADTRTPLEGATISNGRTTVQADADGRFVIQAKTGDQLTISYTGMTQQTITIRESAEPLKILMQSNGSDLEQVVMTGYRAERKKDLTGAVAVVSLKDIRSIPASNPMLALQGHVPGVYIEADGSPTGGNRRVLIRGLNTLGNTNPLYIIDGVPTSRPEVFRGLNANSIASMQVLKDASAASIYGSRASNGVIIVTTRDGSQAKGHPTISLNSSFSVQSEKRWREPVLTAEQRGWAFWRASVNDRTDPGVHSALYTFDWNEDYDNPILNKVNIQPFVGGDPNVPVGNTDWQEETWEPARVQSHDITIAASSDKSNMLINVGYFDNSGMLVYTNYRRLNARINSSTKLFGGKLRIGENLALSTSRETLGATDLGGTAVTSLSVNLAPTIPVFTKDGKYAGPIGAGYSDRNNPVHMQYINRWDRSDELIVFGNLYAELEVVKNLTLRSNVGIDYSNNSGRNIEQAFQEGFLGRATNSLQIGQGVQTSLNLTNTINYQWRSGTHSLNVLAGSEAFRQDFTQSSAYREGFAIEEEDFYQIDAGTGRSANSGNSSGYRLMSLFAKAAYSFSDKYLATVTARRDGSSRFGAANRYGIFPAATVGWRISKESFFNVPAVSELKFRAGYGKVGNQEIGNTASFGTYQPNYGTIIGAFGSLWASGWLNTGTAYDLGGTDGGTLPSGYVSVQGGNDRLKWESTAELNLGIDFGLFNDALTGSFDVFSRKTSDILILPPLASAIGEGRIKWYNGAKKTNRGWELLLNYRGTAGRLQYAVTGTAGHFQDRITELPAEVRTAYPGNAEQTIIGQSQSAVFGYLTDGLFQNQREVDDHANQTGKGIGRLRYVDLNGDGSIDAFDQTWLGTTLPKLEYGLKIDLSFRHFDLTVFGSGVAGKKGYDDGRLLHSFFDQRQNNGTGILNAWTPENPTSSTPMLSLLNTNNETRTSNFFIVNGSYFRLRNIQIGYNVPAPVLSRIRSEAFRVYVGCQNVFVIKDKSYVSQDPERIGSISYWPQPTTFTIGINTTF